MTQSWNSPVITCRPALPSDKADMLEFTKFIWDGHDYIKYVWDEWYADPDGIMVSAEYGGHCVGFAKVSLSAPGQWWFQGFRVDPQYQDLKIGSHIHAYLDQWWLEHGDGVARLMTSSKRTKVHHLCEKFGYSKILEVKELEAAPLAEPGPDFEPVHTDEIRAALEAALASPVLALGNGLFDQGWDAIHPTEEILAGIIEKGIAYWWRGRQGLLLGWNDSDETDEVLGISLPACPLDLLTGMLLDIRRLAASLGRSNAFWIAPFVPECLSAAEKAGYAFQNDHAGFLFQKQHPARP